ncbi:MAG: MmgE/PrpD family protein [Chloroflexota bacterium]|nr:MmgE/PrpD family protein [Dehalococcoidia bacterium]MDW8255251.1 MmgE/PrpD family protein [Chloroflexota bacterium]
MRIFTERDVEAAAAAGAPLVIPPGAIVTPAARDRLRALGREGGRPSPNGAAPAVTPAAAAPVDIEADDLSGPLTAFVGLPAERVPREVLEFTATLLLDCLAVALAGRIAEGTTGLVAALRAGSRGPAPVIGFPDRLSAPDAALANGALVHSTEFDPAFEAGLIHSVAGAVPAALAAAAEARLNDGRALLAAIAVAGEVACRVSAAALGVPTVYRCGAMGAFAGAAAGARVAGLDRMAARHAFGIAASLGAPCWQPHAEGSSVHGALPGFGARAGLLAVAIARHGGTGPADVLEGPSGYYRTYEGGRWDRARALEGLGERWLLLDSELKPYPCGRLTHGAIDGALALRAEGLRPEEVEGIVIECSAVIAERTGRTPAPDASLVHQRLSVPFTVAQALLRGRVGLGEIAPGAAADPAARELMARIEVRAAPDIPPGAFVPVRLQVRTRAGAVLRREVTALRGSRARPLSRDERLAKVAHCWSVAGLPAWRTPDALIRAVEALPDGGAVERVMAALPVVPSAAAPRPLSPRAR